MFYLGAVGAVGAVFDVGILFLSCPKAQLQAKLLQGKLTNTGTKAADVFANFLAGKH